MASKPIQILSEAIAGAAGAGAGAGAGSGGGQSITLNGFPAYMNSPQASQIGTVDDLGNGFQRLMIEYNYPAELLGSSSMEVALALTNYRFWKLTWKKLTWKNNVRIPCTVLLDGSPVAGVLTFFKDYDEVTIRCNVPLKTYENDELIPSSVPIAVDVTVSTDILPIPSAYTDTPTIMPVS